MAKRRRKADERAIARERIRILFDEAEKAAHDGRLDRADRYVELARLVGMRYNVPIPRDLKSFMCRKCGAYLLPGETSRVRTRGTRVATTCLRCGHVRRVPFQREQKQRRRDREHEPASDEPSKAGTESNTSSSSSPTGVSPRPS